ncbi:MAG: hypothetical protein MMC33_002117 [Icmadophila ericetorum]|nr:hypothetical protein [Icmadophila ericetorum]
MAPPKAVLFDIGGVCVVSPFQAIVDYERKNGIPTDYINFVISRSAPNGYWHRLERGEAKMDADFFKGFSEDLHSPRLWKDYHTSFRKQWKLRDVANPSQLGDPVSLKAETADSSPTNQDRGSKSSSWSQPKKSLKDLAKENPTMLGDPVSLKAENVDSSPTDQDRGAQSSKTSPSTSPRKSSQDPNIPPLPSIDAEFLFWEMMRVSQDPDPYMFPALQALKRSHNDKFLIAALSNTVIFPSTHPYAQRSPTRRELDAQFDIFISSAEVGLRKPHREIYELAIKMLDEFDREKRGGSGIKAGDILFLDDIGQNLKMAREVGMRTIKVLLGKTWRAVKELEEATGVELMDEKTKRSKL